MDVSFNVNQGGRPPQQPIGFMPSNFAETGGVGAYGSGGAYGGAAGGYGGGGSFGTAASSF